MEKIFVFDIDGTLIKSNEEIGVIISEMFDEILKNGNRLILATARSIRGVRHVIPDKYLDNIVIYCNGAFIAKGNEIIYSDYINRKSVEELIVFLDKEKVEYYIEFGSSYYHLDGQHKMYKTLAKEAPTERINDIAKYLDKPVYKISILNINGSDNLLKLVEKKYKKLKCYIHEDNSVDVVLKTTSKWNALKNVIGDEISNVKIISFGNDLNDYELLLNSSYSVAVSPKEEKIKSIANKVLNVFDNRLIQKTVYDILSEEEI